MEEQLQRLKAFYLTKVPPTDEDDAEVKYWSNSAERRWQLFLKKSFVTQDLGLEFLNLVNMVRITLSKPMPSVDLNSAKSRAYIPKFNLSINQPCWQREVFSASLTLDSF